jgi:hypothetical protein
MGREHKEQSMNATIAPLPRTLVLLCALAVPISLAAQDHADKPRHHHNKLFDLGTLGGPHSYGSVNGDGFALLNDFVCGSRGRIHRLSGTPARLMQFRFRTTSSKLERVYLQFEMSDLFSHLRMCI